MNYTRQYCNVIHNISGALPLSCSAVSMVSRTSEREEEMTVPEEVRVLLPMRYCTRCLHFYACMSERRRLNLCTYSRSKIKQCSSVCDMAFPLPV